jgi:hypothetical protein
VPLHAHVMYTYPDRVLAHEPFNVGVTIEYINDKSAKSGWVLFSNVFISLRAFENPKGPDLQNSSEHDTSGLIVRGSAYSHNFTIRAPNSGRYLLFLAFDAFFSPESVGSGEFSLRTSEAYNNANPPPFIGPNDLPPITVIDKEHQVSTKEGRLIVGIEDPYSYMVRGGVNVGIDGRNCTISESSAVINGKNCTNPVNGTVSVPPTNHSVNVPGTLDIVKDKIRAHFWRWSDGNEDNPRTVAVASNTNTDLFAVYKTQYYLSVKSSCLGTFANGSGWYDAGSNAKFALDPGLSFFLMHSFDHWIGDMGSSDPNVAAGAVSMDGPKEITAEWKIDYGYLAILIGLVTGIGAIK